MTDTIPGASAADPATPLPTLHGLVSLLSASGLSRMMWGGRAVVFAAMMWPAMEHQASKTGRPLNRAMFDELATIPGLQSFVASNPETSIAAEISKFLISVPGYSTGEVPGYGYEYLGYIKMQIDEALEFRA